MRVRTALVILLAVNAVWAAAFLGYIRRSTIPVIRPADEKPTITRITASITDSNTISSLSATQLATPTNPVAGLIPVSHQIRSLPSSDKRFGWRDVTNETYRDYVASLRAVGCPEKQIRSIAVADVNELFDQRRLQQAIASDPHWWKAETYMGILPMQNPGGQNFDDQRRTLLTQILGEDGADGVKLVSLNASSVNLTGPVLGALPAETWNNVQEICARSIDRGQAYQMARINENGVIDNTELAKLRDQTRTDLKKVLTPEQLEEFLLRFSHNSTQLRQNLRGLEVTPEEFRKIFRAIDPLEHQMQVDYGGLESLSPKQREQLESQRDRAVKETLSSEHFAQYLASKDPLFKQAQITAMQYGLNAKAVQPLYELQKNLDARRAKVAADAAMSAEQKARGLESISVEHQQTLQRMLTDPTYRQMP